MKPIYATIFVAVLTVAGILLAGCGGKYVKGTAPTNQPANSFEKYSYQTLLDAQVALGEIDKRIKSGELPAATRSDYDRAAVIYNTAIAALSRYDQVVRAGNDPTQLQTEIASDLTDLLSLIDKLFPQKKAAAPPSK